MSSEAEAKPRAQWNNKVQSVDERYALKRRALLHEAGKAFSRGGFAHTSLDDVAKTLGVSKPALYYYFKNKGEILYECHKEALDLGDQARDEAENEGGTARERLSHLIVRYVELLTSEIGICAVLTEHYALADEDRTRIQKRRKTFDTYLRGLIIEGMSDGSLGECDPRLTVILIMGAVNSINSWYSPDGEMSGRQIAEELMRYVTHGIAPRS